VSKSSIKSYQLFSILVLLVMTIAFVRFAMAFAAFTPQAEPTGYVAQYEISNYNLSSGNEMVFAADYEREYWSGNLHAYSIAADGTVDYTDNWTLGAANSIDGQNWDTQRFIATMSDAGTGIPFRYTKLTATQKLLVPPTTITYTPTSYAATSQELMDFLHGDRSNEVDAKLRLRNSVLGDIVHSRPYYVADASYPTLFVGANDGMLHAINATDGTERWAYVPSMLLSKMVNLAKPYGTTGNPHDYFVDGQINVGSITVSGAKKRILVGLLGAGGKGIYALNIDSSAGLAAATETVVAAKVMWEIDGATNKLNYAATSVVNDYRNLGYTYGIPTIAKTGTGDYAVILGNGYNDNSGGDYQAYLYVINANTGQLIKAIKAGTSGTAASPNGLVTTTSIDTKGDGVVDRVYAGDLNGTLWKFDLSSGVASSWTATALYATSPAQPITAGIGVSSHPSGGFMVNFGTGSMFTDAKTDTATYYAYGIWDGATGTNIIDQLLQERTYGAANTRVRHVTTNVIPNWTTDKGWRVPLPIAGERIIGEGNLVESKRYYFTSYNPTKFILTPDPCTLPSCKNQTTVYGENWVMELDYLSGGVINKPFLDMDNNQLLNDSDRIVYSGTDVLPTGSKVGDLNLNTDGVPVGQFMSNGVASQPILAGVGGLKKRLVATNSDIPIPVVEVALGVTGGHFDEDIYYGSPICADGAKCSKQNHTHQYDDKFLTTGVNMLNPSESKINLANAIPLTTTEFKVIAQNQYLNPAVKLHIGDASYKYNIDSGYISIKNFVTSATLDVAALPTYTRANIGSLVVNMPTDALTSKDWWGNGDIRAGLHPTPPSCVNVSEGTGDSNLYWPVMPPTNGVDGPGVSGTAANGYAGARHNGALTIQLIKAATPNTSIELNVSGRPEYGWRVKKADYATYVLAEYNTWWHHPSDICYGVKGWTKSPPEDNGSSKPQAAAKGSTDPKIGDLSGSSSSTVVSVKTTKKGNVKTTTITYEDGSITTIVSTINTDGSNTIVTRLAGCVSSACETTVQIAKPARPPELPREAGTKPEGRVSWRELIPE